MTEAELVKVLKPIFEALYKRFKTIERNAADAERALRDRVHVLESRSVERVRALEAQVSALQRNKELTDSRLGLLEQMTK